jgi:predicted unusual protein kinase regulating ubiquinone biosynthesis (AarF/ABC1/UbiB family)
MGMARQLIRGCGFGVVGIGGAAACACGVGAATSPGFRRSCQFWGAVAPFVLEHNQIKWRARIEGCDAEELERRLSEFHQRTATQAVAVILRLGGIYVKIGQFASTMGNGILQDAYIAALRPLQDGVPPRPLSEVSAIIEASVGVPMAELFESFDELPVGAASIAQAHRARLAGSGEVHMIRIHMYECICICLCVC